RFLYSVRDNQVGAPRVATAFVRVNVPTAGDDFGETQGTQPVTINVLENDTDPDGNEHLVPSSVTVVAGPQNGSVAVDPATGTTTTPPAAGPSDNDSFKYTVSDDNGAPPAPATVVVINTLPGGSTPAPQPTPPSPTQSAGAVSLAFGPR